MQVVVDSLIEGARRARGAVVIIDVFRAFTTAAVALANGAERVVMVSDVDQALALRERGVGQLCMGEVEGTPPEGFDHGNSPYAISMLDLSGRTVIQRTSAGTQGIVAASGADRLFAGALVTASACARVMKDSASDRASVVAMGKNGVVRTDEDELCALHLRNLLEGRPGAPEAVKAAILAGSEAARFLRADGRDAHPEDLAIALDIDRYDFAIEVRMNNGLAGAYRVAVDGPGLSRA
ncbi:MAG: 2-phosphosulfolactate phosphatase [Gammaproteobacteria bacterium]|nr:2-phosphosulfolactate phosphatase [Gammaproteobacteria bacterium]